MGEETHVPKVVSSNLGTLFVMDIFSHLLFVMGYNVFENTKINGKEAGMDHF